jgi:C4-dicarboxylate-specific signal transduction histidine kinase
LRSALEEAGHVCSIYNTLEECLDVLREFVEVGLGRGEKCLCLVSLGSEDSFRETMRAASAQIDRAVEVRAVDVTSIEGAYLTYKERFTQHVLRFWRAAVDEALAAGFSGLRGVIQVDRALGGTAVHAHWIDYESRLTQVLSQSGGSMLCLFNRLVHPAGFVREALRAHAVVAHRGMVGENTFHVPPAEYDAPDRAAREVDRMLTSLSDGWGFEDTSLTREITESELARASRVITLGYLMASIAHEVNQPLAALVANAGAGLRWLGGDNPRIDQAKQALTRIVRDGNRASEVIAHIRALVRKADAERNSLDLNRVIEEVIALLKTELRRNKIVVRTGLAGNLALVWGDRVQLQQVLLNLIMNAIEAMGAMRRTRVLSIATMSDSGGVSVSVEDRGVGLDQEALERIFEPFFTTKPEGMGIGLAISRSIIETHGGLLWATRNRGPGATFKLRLPTARTDAQ